MSGTSDLSREQSVRNLPGQNDGGRRALAITIASHNPHGEVTAEADTCGVDVMSSTRELVDSRELFGDWQALRARIASDGYVFLRGLLDADEVRGIGRSGLAQLQSAGWTESGGDPVTALPRTPVHAVRMRDAAGDSGYRRILTDPGFNRIPFQSPLTDLMGQILGPAGFCYPLKVPRIVYPTALVPQQPGNVIHKDYRSVQDMFTCWLPLGDVPTALGGLAIKKRSHHSSRVRYRPLTKLEVGWITTDYQPGDVLVFHCLTTHAALPNQSDRMRFSAEYRWQLGDQPAPRRLVVGPRGYEIGSRLFSRTQWWRPVAQELTLFDDGGEDRRSVLPAPPSRFVSFTN